MLKFNCCRFTSEDILMKLQKIYLQGEWNATCSQTEQREIISVLLFT